MLAILLALAAAPALAPSPPRPWPLPLSEDAVDSLERRVADLDGDGVADEIVEAQDGGSGWRHGVTCARDGASGHVACEEFAATPYALFDGWRRLLDPPADNRAVALLNRAAGEDLRTGCPGPDETSAAQGTLFALRAGAPMSGDFRPTLRWRPGRPAAQVNVCLSLAEAEAFPTALGWHEGKDGEGWVVRYVPRWPSLPSLEERPGREPKPVAALGEWPIHQQGAALAVYDPAQDQHAWIASWAHDSDGFKLDRWERISAVQALDSRTLLVTIATLDEPSTVRVVVR